MKLYLKFLAGFYFVGFLLHCLDLANLRLNFWELGYLWQSWIVFLVFGDLVAAIGLWRNQFFGVLAFHVVAAAQLLAYSFLRDIFGDQSELIVFHVLTLLIFYALLARRWPGHIIQ